jgi:hypothetical protein
MYKSKIRLIWNDQTSRGGGVSLGALIVQDAAKSRIVPVYGVLQPLRFLPGVNLGGPFKCLRWIRSWT